jgi:hypothetical protein
MQDSKTKESSQQTDNDKEEELLIPTADFSKLNIP